MSLLAAEKRMGSLTSYNLPGGAYDQDQLGLGGIGQTSQFQFNGATAETQWAGPFPVNVIRTQEMSGAGAVAQTFPSAVEEKHDVMDWIFVTGALTAAATHRVYMYTFNRTTQVSTFQGYITFTFPNGTNYTPKGFRASLEMYTTGSAAVLGTAVTGTLTTWQTDRICEGCRIGFGSTDPTAITTWYEISAIGGEGSITLTTAAPVAIPDGPYVIEDLRLYWAMLNATAANGGLIMAKGLRKELFATAGYAMNIQPNADNKRGTYFLRDANPCTNTTACGLGLDTKTSWTAQDIYVLDINGTTCTMFKYNVRSATIAPAAGIDDAHALVAKTGTYTTAGTAPLQQGMTNPVTTAHGAGSGVKSLYFVTTGAGTSRAYRVTCANVVTAGTNFVSGLMTELGLFPGGATTYTEPNLTTILYLPGCDRFLFLNGATAGTGKSLFTAWYEDNRVLDRIILYDDFHLDQSTMDPTMVPHSKGVYGVQMVGCQLNGLTYIQSAGTTLLLGHMFIYPFDSDWGGDVSTAEPNPGSYIISPRILCPGNIAFNKAFAEAIRSIGQTVSGTFDTGLTGHNFGISTEPFRVFYRTDATGIANNSGTWYGPLNSLKDLSSVPAAAQIQFKIQFRVAGTTCFPSRLLSIGVTYYDGVGDGHYQPSATHSDRVNKWFAWRFCTAFGGAVPTLYIRVYDAVTGALLVTDDSSTAGGSWKKSTDGGGTWVNWTNADKANDITYLRWQPAVLADNFIAKATLNLT